MQIKKEPSKRPKISKKSDFIKKEFFPIELNSQENSNFMSTNIYSNFNTNSFIKGERVKEGEGEGEDESNLKITKINKALENDLNDQKNKFNFSYQNQNEKGIQEEVEDEDEELEIKKISNPNLIKNLNQNQNTNIPFLNYNKENFNAIDNLNNTLELDDQIKFSNQNLQNNQISLVSKILNQNYSNSLLPYGLVDTKLVQNFLMLMKKDLKIENKLEISITLNKTNNPTVLELFLEFEGAKILTNFLMELKDKINDQIYLSKNQNIYDAILLNIFNFCERLKISLHDLKYSKIGKMVNNFAKSYTNNKEIQLKSANLVKKWKKIVDDKKEKDKDKEKDKVKDKDREREKDKEREKDRDRDRDRDREKDREREKDKIKNLNPISNLNERDRERDREREREKEKEKSENNLLSKKKHNESIGNFGNGIDKNNKKYIIYKLSLLYFISIISIMNREINNLNSNIKYSFDIHIHTINILNKIIKCLI
jgi:hypothetical protein